jgi:hypothetical protein
MAYFEYKISYQHRSKFQPLRSHRPFQQSATTSAEAVDSHVPREIPTSRQLVSVKSSRICLCFWAWLLTRSARFARGYKRQFIHEEYANTRLFYGTWDRIWQAASEQGRRFPNCPHSRKVVLTAYISRGTGSFTSPRLCRARRGHDQEMRAAMGPTQSGNECSPNYSTNPIPLTTCERLRSLRFRLVTNLFYAETQWTWNGITYCKNKHVCSPNKPHHSTASSYKHCFSANVWCGLIDDHPMGHLSLGVHIEQLITAFPTRRAISAFGRCSSPSQINMWLQYDYDPADFGS